ncbi:MAG: alpha/beta hydrolase [Alphaproteobacteria bacterium]|nr:alpha/beta hydrolase [Alphaproteobacteria bacterium]
MKWIKLGIGAIVLLLALAIIRYWTPDISHEELADKYAVGASDFITLPSGAQAHYRMEGNAEGPTILLLHGSNASLHTWEGWVDALETDYLVVTVDLPGHGLTGPTPADDYTYSGMVAFVDEFTTALDIDHFILGGNSMGGGVSLSYAIAHPERLQALVLVDAAGTAVPENTRIPQKLPAAFDLAGHWYSDWILENITPRAFVLEGLKTSITDHSLIDEAMIDRYWELVRHPGNRRATGKRFAWYRQGRSDLPVEQITKPTLILWGDNDSLIPVETGHSLKKRIGGAQLVTYPNIGHIPMEEIPAISANAVKGFLSSLPIG